ncbi:MAG: copper transporter [Armatimonadetes bacterium]|nr:copper transporter [Armatimonadota bacterium]
MIDIKYHVYSLAAVFFALAAGIVFGTTFAKSSPPTESVRRTIQRYENSMRILKREIEKASLGAAKQEALARSCEEFCKAVLPTIAANRLQWRNVAIIQTGDYDDVTGSVKYALELAGARVVSVTTISRAFDFEDDQRIISTLTNLGIALEGNGKQAREKLFSIIVDTIRAGTHVHLLSKLESAGIAKFLGSYDGHVKPRLFVIVGGSASEKTNMAETIDAALLAAIDKPDVTVVACESTEAVSSYVPVWHKWGIATVDNANTAMGQVALLCALNGENARFGVKDTADRLIPQTLEAR